MGASARGTSGMASAPPSATSQSVPAASLPLPNARASAHRRSPSVSALRNATSQNAQDAFHLRPRRCTGPQIVQVTRGETRNLYQYQYHCHQGTSPQEEKEQLGHYGSKRSKILRLSSASK